MNALTATAGVQSWYIAPRIPSLDLASFVEHIPALTTNQRPK